MTAREMERVIHLVKSGCVVKISGPYVDGFATVRQEGDKWCISSQVWAETPLRFMQIDQLSFYRPVPF